MENSDPAKPLKQFTKEEVKEHNSEKSCWVIFDDKVYDVTAFLDDHPGGGDLLLEKAGGDGTKAFVEAAHSKDAKQIREKYLIGEILPRFSREEVKKHNSEQSCWIILDEKIYDVTPFLDDHPGGGDLLLEKAGADGTKDFKEAAHSKDAIELRKKYLVGELIKDEISEQKTKKMKKKKKKCVLM